MFDLSLLQHDYRYFFYLSILTFNTVFRFLIARPRDVFFPLSTTRLLRLEFAYTSRDFIVVGSVLLIFLVLCVVLFVLFTFFCVFFLQSYTFIHHYLLTMHLGRPGSTKGHCFTIKDHMHTRSDM
jgi:hypothetical protein